MADRNREERVVAELKRLITDELEVPVAPDEIDPDAALFADGLGIDSIAVVELIAMAEERFGVEFTDADLLPHWFSSIRTFAQLIAAKPDVNLAG